MKEFEALLKILFLWELGMIIVAQAQVAQDLPACALACAATAAEAAGCSLNDTACLCTSAGFLTAAQRCALQACSGPDQGTAAVAFARLCNEVSISRSSSTAVSSPISITAIPPTTSPVATTIVITLTSPPATLTIFTTIGVSDVTPVPSIPQTSLSTTSSSLGLSSTLSGPATPTPPIPTTPSALPTTTFPAMVPTTSTTTIFPSQSTRPLPTTSFSDAANGLGGSPALASISGLAWLLSFIFLL